MKAKIKSLSVAVAAVSAAIAQQTSAFDLTINGNSACPGFTNIQVTHDSSGNVSITTQGANLAACVNGNTGGTDNPSLNDFNPVITTSSVQQLVENNQLVTALAATDADAATTGSLDFSITGGADAALFTVNSGNLEFISAPDYEAQGSAAGSNAYVVQVTVTDNDSNGAKTTNKTLTVNVTDDTSAVTDPDPDNSVNNYDPVISGGPTATYNVQEGNTAVGTASASDGDVDTTGTLGFSLSGADAALFDVDSGGVITFNNAPDFEAPGSSLTSNQYSFTLTVTDNDSTVAKQAVQAITVNVTDDVSDNTGACGPTPAGVALGSNFDLNNPGNLVRIPMTNQTLAMEFTSLASGTGTFDITATTGNSGIQREVWVSECPGAPDYTNVYKGCRKSGTSTTVQKYHVGSNLNWKSCNLTPNTKYYLNVRNVGCNSGTCDIYRQVNVY